MSKYKGPTIFIGGAGGKGEAVRVGFFKSQHRANLFFSLACMYGYLFHFCIMHGLPKL